MGDHPVWNVYDELRTARLNVCYFRARLGRARRWHTGRELIMALTGSAGVAGLWLFATAPGLIVWKGLASLSALLAVYHSVTRPSERIRKLETQVTAWLHLEHALGDVRRRIHEAGRYDAAFQGEVKAILDGKQSIVADWIDAAPDEKLRRRCFDEVNREMPVNVFFVPEP